VSPPTQVPRSTLGMTSCFFIGFIADVRNPTGATLSPPSSRASSEGPGWAGTRNISDRATVTQKALSFERAFCVRGYVPATLTFSNTSDGVLIDEYWKGSLPTATSFFQNSR
jgi:hypothetical protein